MIIVISQSPFNNLLSLEALELTLGLSAFGVDITLIFIDDGVYHLQADTETTSIASKNFLKNLNCLELYDINKVYLCKRSLNNRKITLSSDFHCGIIDDPLQLLQDSQHNLIL